jgi:hypothetical protein
MTATRDATDGEKIKKLNPFPYANVVKEADRRRQLRLLQMSKGRCVVEIIRVIETRSGDDVFVTFFGKNRTAGAEEKLIASIWLVEQKSHTVRLEEVVHRDGTYFLNGKDLANLLMTGDYTF